MNGWRRRRKFCFFCKEEVPIDYKNIDLLKRFVSDKGKIRSRRSTGTCAKHQRKVSKAIKRAREIALLPYVKRTK